MAEIRHVRDIFPEKPWGIWSFKKKCIVIRFTSEEEAKEYLKAYNARYGDAY